MDLKMGEKIKARRLALGYSLRELADKAGSTASSVRKWETGDIASMKTEKLKQLAKALEVSPLWLMGLEDDSLPLARNLEPIPEGRPLPVYGSINCGDPAWAEQSYEETVQGPEGADFVLRAEGDSMINARIFPGDLVFIKSQSDVENGEIAAVLIDHEATLKRVYKYDGRVELRPENPLYKVIQYEGEDLKDLKILGKAVSFFSEKL